MTPRPSASPLRFKDALEQRLRNAAADGVAFTRARQMLVFDRFLARVAAGFGDAAVLKGGLVLDLRLDRARTTRDIYLRMLGTPHDLLPRFQCTARIDLGDFMAFEVVPHPGGADTDNDALRYEGFRFRVACTLAGKPYGEPFGVDVAFGEPMLWEPDVFTGADLLAFAGIAPPTVRRYPVETHLAEKFHAYTMPCKRPNSRVKDLPDIALLASARALDAPGLRAGGKGFPREALAGGGASSRRSRSARHTRSLHASPHPRRSGRSSTQRWRATTVCAGPTSRP